MSTSLETAFVATFIGLALIGGGGFFTQVAQTELCKKVPDSAQYTYCQDKKEASK
jgi:hypothetical protein